MPSLILIGCAAPGKATSSATATSQLPPALIPQTRTPTVVVTSTRAPITGIPTPTIPGRTETTVIKVHFDTYETEETIGAELSKVKGIVGIVVNQSQITVTYDPQVLTRAEIIKVINQNPEVRIEEP